MQPQETLFRPLMRHPFFQTPKGMSPSPAKAALIATSKACNRLTTPHPAAANRCHWPNRARRHPRARRNLQLFKGQTHGCVAHLYVSLPTVTLKPTNEICSNRYRIECTEVVDHERFCKQRQPYFQKGIVDTHTASLGRGGVYGREDFGCQNQKAFGCNAGFQKPDGSQ